MPEILFSYPIPENNPNCVCSDPMQSMFCTTGHMTECHSGLACSEARCAHLPKYSGEIVDFKIENPLIWKLVTQYRKEIITEMFIYAPSAEDAKSAYFRWIQNTEPLVKIQNDIVLEITPGTEEQIEEFIKRVQELKND